MLPKTLIQTLRVIFGRNLIGSCLLRSEILRLDEKLGATTAENFVSNKGLSLPLNIITDRINGDEIFKLAICCSIYNEMQDYLDLIV